MFEDYLREIHAENYGGLDDNMAESFDAFIESLDQEELIHYGNEALKIYANR